MNKITWSDHLLNMNLFEVGTQFTRKQIRKIGSLPDNPGPQENWGGIVSLNNVVLIFVTLDKGSAKKEYKYIDYFEDRDFMWESQNSNTLATPSIKRIMNEDNTFLFIRTASKINGITQPFTYIGGIYPVDFDDGVKPLKFQFECLDYQSKPNDLLAAIYAWRSGAKLIPTIVADPERPKKRKTSEGKKRDQARKDATEMRGMEVAKDYYELLGYKVEDCSMKRKIGYDYLCQKGKEVIEVEVKGKSTDLDTVIVTKNEVNNALTTNNRCDLFIVFNIEHKYSGKTVKGVNGETHLIKRWNPRKDDLTALEYLYKVNI